MLPCFINLDMFIELVKELISIGISGIIPENSNLSKFLLYSDGLLRENITSSLTNDDLVNVFKGWVIVETDLPFYCGSTTPASFLYKIIESRGLDNNYNLANWAFQYSDNEYIPFGFIRHGEKTAYEYIQWRAEYRQRLIAEKTLAKNNEEQRRKRSEQIYSLKSMKDAENTELYETIKSLPPHRQIEIIIDDHKHQVLYYMPVISTLLERDDVETSSWSILLSKFQAMKATPFNIQIIKRIKEKIK